MSNESGVHPVGEKVLVKRILTERKTAGGILIPESNAQKQDIANIKAQVVEIGPLAFQEERRFELTFNRVPTVPEAGQFVCMARYAGYDIEGKDGEMYRVIADADVTAILDEQHDSVRGVA